MFVCGLHFQHVACVLRISLSLSSPPPTVPPPNIPILRGRGAMAAAVDVDALLASCLAMCRATVPSAE